MNGERTASAITSQATSTGCRARPFAALRFNYRFTIAKPMWATLSYTKTGGSYVEAYVSGSSNPGDAGSYEELYGWSSKGQGSSTVYLPAGAYQGYVQGEPGLTAYATSTVVHDSKGSVKIDLAPAGSAITLPSGSAQSYARLGKARSCTTHTLPAALTSDSTRIKKISRVSFAVNGTTVKSLKGTSIKRGLAIKIPIADSVKASVKTTVTLKNGDKRTATASYRACA